MKIFMVEKKVEELTNYFFLLSISGRSGGEPEVPMISLGGSRSKG